MCRGKNYCVEFGEPQDWSRVAPLQPPAWLREEVFAFGEAARLAATGDIATARSQFAILRSDDAREWVVEHGQISASHRRRVLALPRPGPTVQADRRRTSAALKRQVWARDHYQCRYCGLPTIPDDVRLALQQVLGPSALPWGKTNAARHGVALVGRTEYDHVQPVSLGGADDEANIVTACAGCNYGKDRYTVAELGLDDPRSRVLAPSSWNGLTSLLPALAALARSSSLRGSRVGSLV